MCLRTSPQVLTSNTVSIQNLNAVQKHYLHTMVAFLVQSDFGMPYLECHDQEVILVLLHSID